MESILVKDQTKTYGPVYYYDAQGVKNRITATVRYDDRCGNGHNTFSITGEIRDQRGGESGGCIHDDIAQRFPSLAPLIKWHLCSSDGPLYYVANTLYWANDYHGLLAGKFYFRLRDDDVNCLVRICDANEREGLTAKYGALARFEAIHDEQYRTHNLDNARSVAIWPDATLEQLRDKAQLLARLPGLLQEFRAAVESLGFVY